MEEVKELPLLDPQSNSDAERIRIGGEPTKLIIPEVSSEPLKIFGCREEVMNRFGGDKIILSPKEVAVYDLTMGSEILGDWVTVRKCLAWFRENNPEAYMILLD